MTRLRALELAIEGLENMHGSLTGEDEHESEPIECGCEYGQAIQILTEMEDCE